MGLFPALATPWGTLLLPLTERTAHRLTSALLAAGESRADCLALAIEQDPNLALWALCRAQARDLPVTSLAALAPWISDSLACEWSRSGAENVALAATVSPPAVSEPALIQAAAVQAGSQLSCERERAFLQTAGSQPGNSNDELIRGAVERLQTLAAKLVRLQALAHDFERTLATEKLESLRQLAYGAGHEINNPLANISARAQTLLNEETDPERRRKLAAINAQAFRAHEMIADMMLFARPPKPKLQLENLWPLAESVVRELQPWAGQQQTELSLLGPVVDVAVPVDKTQLAVALRALLVNALESLSGGGRIDVSLVSSQAADSGHGVARLSVFDTGPGLSEQARRHLFDPFFSGREAGRGLGLGLSKCWRIVSMHGGKLEVESATGTGTRFTICLDLPSG